MLEDYITRPSNDPDLVIKEAISKGLEILCWVWDDTQFKRKQVYIYKYDAGSFLPYHSKTAIYKKALPVHKSELIP